MISNECERKVILCVSVLLIRVSTSLEFLGTSNGRECSKSVIMMVSNDFR